MTSLGTSIRLSAGYCISCTLERYDAASLRNYLSQESNQKRPANKAVSKRARSQKLAPVIKNCLSSSSCSRHLTPAKSTSSSLFLAPLTSHICDSSPNCFSSSPSYPFHIPSPASHHQAFRSQFGSCTNAPRTLLPVCSNGCPTTIFKNRSKPLLRSSMTLSSKRLM